MGKRAETTAKESYIAFGYSQKWERSKAEVNLH